MNDRYPPIESYPSRQAAGRALDQELFATLADAICDRFLHNAYRIELRGDSMRRKLADTMKATDSPKEGGGAQALKTQTKMSQTEH